MIREHPGYRGRVGLCYFSGTGNTEIVAELLQAAFERHEVRADLFKIEDVLCGRACLDPECYDFVGVGHPVYALGAPRIVHEFVDMLPPAKDKCAFVFKSAADFIAINHAASKTLIRRLEAKGYRVFYDRIFCMASNWLVGYDDRLTKQLYEAAIAKTEHMCQDILAERERTLPVHSLLGVLAQVVHMGQDWAARLFGKELHVSDACVGCDRCIQLCPTGNICREGGRIRFGWDCIWCMRCIYACPQKAISPRFSKLFVLKRGYDIRATVANPSVQGEFVTENTRGYYGRFLRYIEDVTL